MAKGFSTMQTNVGNNVRDTSTAMATIIGVYLNDGYEDMAKACMWSDLIDDDFTFESVADQSEYAFSADMSITDFDEELFVCNIATGEMMDRMTEGQFWRERYSSYQDDSIPSGTPHRYVILYEASSLKLDPPPSEAQTYAMPYKKKISDLSGTTAPSISGIERAMEFYATGQAFAYKRDFAAADWYLQRYEAEKQKRVGRERSRINQIYQRISKKYRLTGVRRLTGEVSYDSI